MSIAITEEQHAVQDSIRSWSAGLGTATVRAREGARPEQEPWHQTALWKELARIGVFSIPLSEEVGGAGGSVTDVAVALEQAAEALVPGPILSTVVAAILLDQAGEIPAAKTVLPAVADGHASLALALDPGDLVAAADGRGFRVSGQAEVVLGAAGVSHLLLSARTESEQVWFVLEEGQEGVTVEEREAVDFSRPVGRVRLRDVPIELAELVPLDASLVRDLLMTLAAAEACGVVGWCLNTAVEYARTREQFGRAIGGFQAVKHLCADMLCRVEQSRALAWDAARSWDEGTGEHPLAAAVAGTAVLDAAVNTAKDCIQVLGGIGFTWEHDAHLYLRRVVAARQLLTSPRVWARRVAELALSGTRRHIGIGALPPEVERERPEVRADIERIAALAADQQRAELADSGYLAPHWPKPYGLDAAPARQLLIDEELRRAGVERPDLVVGAWAVPTILEHGTAAQQDRLVGPTLRGEIIWCQLFSEPGAGSDLASLRARAERVSGGWRLTGQKVWTSKAREAHWAICLARSDPDAPTRRGITYFLVDMSAPGIEVRPLREITGDAVFNEVFLDGVFVPDDCVVGEVHGGWRLARTTLANERVAMGSGSSLGSEVERVLGLVQERGLDADPGVLEQVGGLVAEGLSVSLLRSRVTLRQLGGQDPGPVSSVEKLVGVRHRQEAAELALTLCGELGAVPEGDSAEAVHEFLLSRCLSIAGGTTQILRNVVGERVLGLPREP